MENRRLRFLNRPDRAAYLFLLPSFTILAVFLIVPVAISLFLGLFKLDIFLQNLELVGFRNFVRLFSDPRLRNAFSNTIYYMGVEMPLQVSVALLVALYVSRNTLFRKFLRSIYFVPAVCSMTAVGIMWSLMLDPVLGTIPYYLTRLGFPRVAVLRTPNLAMPAVIATSLWKNFGFSMVIFVAGLQNIPQSFYEAAEMDGCGKVRQFFMITVPLLLPTLGFVTITTTISGFQVFDQVFVMTQGGPLFRTETVVQYIYSRGFTSPYELGYASAIAEVLFVCIMVVTLAMYRYFVRREVTEL